MDLRGNAGKEVKGHPRGKRDIKEETVVFVHNLFIFTSLYSPRARFPFSLPLSSACHAGYIFTSNLKTGFHTKGYLYNSFIFGMRSLR